MMRGGEGLLLLAMCTACVGHPASHAARTGPPLAPDNVVEAWLTTGDRTKLLARQTDLRLTTIAGDTLASTSNAGTVIGQRVATIVVREDSTFQEMVGFGASITDASAWLIQRRMSATQREALLQDLFGRATGIGLSFARLTIGASDFSPSHYSFDDMPRGVRDDSLAHFSIAPNRDAVLPVIKRALAINPALTIMASPWSAPGWMKDADALIKGTLRPDAFPAFAEYLRRYIAAYATEGVPVFAITVQNEPHFEPDDYPGMRLTPPQRANFLAHHLGPLFARHNVPTQILDWDHNWDEPSSPLQVLADTSARRYVSGVAWHCYAGDVSAQSQVHLAHPDKDVYFTECSGGAWASKWSDNFTWYVRTLVVGATRGWARGVLLWNLALDEQHGPHLGGCSDCRGVVTINTVTGDVTRNEEYYALAHASRFVRPGARRIASTSGIEGLESVAFRNADDGSKVLLVVNVAGGQRPMVVRSGDRSFPFVLPAGAVVTFRWR